MFFPVPFGPFGLRPRLNKLETRCSDSRGELADLREVVRRLEKQVENQAHVLQVLHSLLMETHEMTEAAFLERVRQVETERTSAPPKTCLHCGKVLNKKDNRCIYCGEVRPMKSVSELL